MKKTMILLAATWITGAASATIIETYKDSYIRKGEANTNYGSETSALIKLDDPANVGSYTRRTYLGFDYSSIANSSITNVTLNLNFIDSNLGSMSDASAGYTFELYGLTSSWDESTITWNNAPGSDLTLATSLGTFTRTGKGIGTETFSSPELLNFIKENSGVISLVLARNTAASSDQTYIHAITTKENSGYDASSLTIAIPEPAAISFIALSGIAALFIQRRFMK